MAGFSSRSRRNNINLGGAKCSSFCFRAYRFHQLTDVVTKNAGEAAKRQRGTSPVRDFCFVAGKVRWWGFSRHSAADTKAFTWVERGSFHLLKWCQMISNSLGQHPKVEMIPAVLRTSVTALNGA